MQVLCDCRIRFLSLTIRIFTILWMHCIVTSISFLTDAKQNMMHDYGGQNSSAIPAWPPTWVNKSVLLLSPLLVPLWKICWRVPYILQKHSLPLSKLAKVQNKLWGLQISQKWNYFKGVLIRSKLHNPSWQIKKKYPVPNSFLRILQLHYSLT